MNTIILGRWYVEILHPDPEAAVCSKPLALLDDGYVLVRRSWSTRGELDKWARVPTSDLVGLWP